MAPGAVKTDEQPLDKVQLPEDVDDKLRKRIEYNSQQSALGFQAPLVWRNIIIMVVLHVLAVCGTIAGPYATWHSWIFFLILYLLSGLGVTAGAHRLWAHRSYKARLPLRVLLMCCNCLSFQNTILEWCRDHRVHHKYTETDADPHNATRGFFFAHVGWLLMRKHPDVLLKGKNVDLSDLRQDRVVMFQRRHYLKLGFLFSWFLPNFLPWLLWGEDPLVAFLVLVAMRYVLTLHSTWLVNSAAHLWGSRSYDVTQHPSDNRFVCFAAIGEGFHNYHHVFPYDYATSEWGPSLNMTTIMIDLFASLGLAYDCKQVSQEAIDRVRRRKGDLSSLNRH